MTRQMQTGLGSTDALRHFLAGIDARFGAQVEIERGTRGEMVEAAR